jgi:hypothetical protein
MSSESGLVSVIKDLYRFAFHNDPVTVEPALVLGCNGVRRDVHFGNIVRNDCFALIQQLAVTKLRDTPVTGTVKLAH